MECRRFGRFVVAKLGHDEDLKGSLNAIAETYKLQSAFVLAGAGMLKLVQFSFLTYPAKRKQFLRRRYKGPFEVGSLTGSLSYFGRRRIWHLHASLTSGAFETLGGHVDRAKVSANLELLLLVLPVRLSRIFDPLTGLKVWRLNRASTPPWNPRLQRQQPRATR
jgi:hypothetical protein